MPYTATLQLRAKVQPSIKFKAKVQPNIKVKAQGLGEMISIRVSLGSTTFLNRGAVAFSPLSLFTFGTEGVWFDPSDLTTLFQDSAGTTPVTAPGNTVGLMLDKSKALALGAELVTNGTFDSGVTGWTADGSNSIDVVGNELRVTLNSATFSGTSGTAYSLVVGRRYSVTVTARQGTTTQGFVARFGTGTGEGDSTPFTSTSSTTKTFSFIATSTTTTPRIVTTSSGGTGTLFVDNISVRELAGNHATQATIAARPTYSVEPVGGRRNLLLQTEAPTNAAWVTSGTSTVTSGITDPDGGSTAFTVKNTGAGGAARYQVVTVISGQTYTNSLWLRRRLGTGAVAILAINGQGGAGQAVTLTSAWQRFVAPAGFTNVASSTTGYMGFEIGTAGDEIDIWHPQLELGSTATPYQRVTTQHDVTEAGVASLGYLYFDGVSDAMATSTITPGTDKAQVFAGVRKLDDDTIGIVAELGADSVDNAGGFFFAAPLGTGANGNFALWSRGSSVAGSPAVGAALAPTSRVATAIADISGDSRVIRLNGVQAGVDTGDQGTGNFLANPLYIGARGGTVIPFTGHLYSLITRFGPTLDAATITSTEIWVAGKTGITI